MVKWILTVMLFSTAPSNVPPEQLQDRDLFEQRHVWALQTTSSAEFSSYGACWSAGDQFVDAVFPVGTMTVRTWCTCDGDAKICADEAVPEVTSGLLQQKRQLLEEQWAAERAFLENDAKKHKDNAQADAKALERLGWLSKARLKAIDESEAHLRPPEARVLSFPPRPKAGARAVSRPFRVVPTFPYPRY